MIDEELSVQRSAIVLSMRAIRARSATSLPPRLKAAPAIAFEPVRTLGCTFAFVPPSPMILVEEVTSGSWAQGVGMRPGDEIVMINKELAKDIFPIGRFMQLIKCRPVEFRFA